MTWFQVLVDCSGEEQDDKTPESAFVNKRKALLQLVEERPVAKTIIFCNKVRNLSRGLDHHERPHFLAQQSDEGPYYLYSSYSREDCNRYFCLLRLFFNLIWIFVVQVETCRKVENVLSRFDRSGKKITVLPYHAALSQETRLESMETFIKSHPKERLFLVCTDRYVGSIIPCFRSAATQHFGFSQFLS